MEAASPRPKVEAPGDGTVRRLTGPWTPTIHSVLKHLEEVGFDGAPRVLGTDDQGREILTWIEGEIASGVWPDYLRETESVVSIGALLRRFHDAIRGFRPPPNAVWRSGANRWKIGYVVRHADIGPGNLVWRHQQAAGLIDWDLAEPGEAIADLALAAWTFLPMAPDAAFRRLGFSQQPDLRGRLESLCAGYGGVEPASLVRTSYLLMQSERKRLTELGNARVEPWVSFRAAGQMQLIEAALAWMERDGMDLLLTA